MTTTAEVLTAARRALGTRKPAPAWDAARFQELGRIAAIFIHLDRVRHAINAELRILAMDIDRCRRAGDELDDDPEIARLTARYDQVAGKLPPIPKLGRPTSAALRTFTSYYLGRREYDGDVQAALQVLLKPELFATLKTEAGHE